MRTIAADVEDCIRVVGWSLDPHGVTASSEFSASSMDTWRRSIGNWLQNPGDAQVLIATSILLDGRTVYGPAELDPRAILLEPENRAALLPSMLRLALALKLPTGFRGNIVVEDSGEHSGTFDIKHGGLLPVVDIARFGALKAGANVTATIERLRAASELGAIEPAHARTLEEAYDLFSALRLEHQIQQLARGDEPNDHVDPNGAFRAHAAVSARCIPRGRRCAEVAVERARLGVGFAIGGREDLFSRPPSAPKRPLHQPVPLAGRVLAGEEQRADRFHQVVVAKRG